MVTVRDSAAVVTEIRVLLAPSFEWENYSQRSGITELLVVVSVETTDRYEVHCVI
jgi:hypothetical protein